MRIGLLIFYTDTVGLRADLAGYAIALCVLWDAVSDPYMGRISDHLSVFGQRRRPFILIGGILLAAGLAFLFFNPGLDSEWAKFLYLFVSYFFVNTAMTIIAVPHSALAGDITDSVDERTELFGWRLLFANLGLLAGTVLPGVAGMFLARGDSMTASVGVDTISAGIMGILILVCMSITLFSTRNLDRHQAVKMDWSLFNSLQEIWTVFKNRKFLVLLTAYVVATFGLAINSSLALYYYRYRLLLAENETRLIIAVFMLVFCIFIPVWIKLSRKLGSIRVLVWNMALLGLMTGIAYPLFPPGNADLPLVAAVLGGIFVGSVVLLDVMVAEIVDGDSAQSGLRRFGLFLGMWKMGGKVSRAIAIAITGNVLAWIDFVPNAEQSPQTSEAIAWIFGPGVGVMLVAGSLVVSRYDNKRSPPANTIKTD